MKRRIVMISIVAGVVVLIVAGVLLYLSRNTNPKILARGNTALSAGQAAQALEYANTYIQKAPDDWRGHWLKGKALMSLGRYDEARPSFQKAIDGAPSNLDATIAMSDTYSIPAVKILSDISAADDPVALRKAAEGLEMAIGKLTGIKASQDKQYLQTQEVMGVNYDRLALAQNLLGKRLERDARVAEAAGAKADAQTHRTASKAKLAKANDSQDMAVSILLDVLKADATRTLAGKTLIEIAVRRDDKASLKLAREYIMALKKDDRPAIPTMKLAMYEVEVATDAAQRKEKINWAIGVLDSVLQQQERQKASPGGKAGDDVEVQLARIRLAHMQSDWKTLESMCNEIIKKDKRQALARWYLAELMMFRNQWSAAERELLSLKTDFPQWPKAYHSYAYAALHNGRTDLALEALRRVTNLDPHAGEARRLLAQTLLKEGFHDQAYTDAKAFYEDQGDNPVAIRLFAQAAYASGHSEAAYKALSSSVQRNRGKATILVAIADGLSRCGRTAEGLSLAKEVAKITPDSEETSLAVAQAMAMAGSDSDARDMLRATIVRYPGSHKARFELGWLYARSGNYMQALDQYRQAAAMDATTTLYLLETARAHFALGMLDAAQDDCRQLLAIDPVNSDAWLLIAQLRVASGQAAEPDETPIKAAIGSLGGLPLATAYLRQGTPASAEKCNEICRAELKKSPDSIQALQLMGQAYLVLGQSDRSIELWTRLIKISPKLPAPYASIARVMASSAKPPAIREAFGKIPSADATQVDLAIADLYRQAGDLQNAAKTYADVSGRASASQDERNMAALRRAQCIANAGDVDAALAAMEAIKGGPSWTQEILFEKAVLLARSNKKDQAAQALDQLQDILRSTASMRQMMVIAGLYNTIDKTDKALDICRQLQERWPHNASPYMLQARILVSMEKGAEAIKCYQKAIEKQPDSFDAYRELSRLLDATGDRMGAVSVLKKLQAKGQAGKFASLSEQAALFAGYGLHEQAAQCMVQLMQMDPANNPALKLSLARAFASIGRLGEATDAARNVPEYSPHYSDAQRLLARIATTDDERLKILRNLTTARPADLGAWGDQLSVLLEAGKSKEAAETFELFMKKQPAAKPLSPVIAHMGMQALMAQNMTVEAKGLCLRMSKQTSAPNWRGLALLLVAQDDPQAARAMLGEPSACKDFNGCLIGLSLGGTAEQIDAWYRQILAIEKQFAANKPPVSVPPSGMLLAAVAAGKVDDANAVVGKFPGSGAIGTGVAVQLVEFARSQSNSSAAAMTLIRAALAMEWDLPALSRQWAMKVFLANPSCQWAAAMILQGGPDGQQLQQVLANIQPSDCDVARLARAAIHTEKQEYKQAAEIYRQISVSEQKNFQFLFAQASMLENAGELSQALVLYEKLMSMTKDPVVANNAAYVQAQLAGDDKVLLQKAHDLAKTAVDKNPHAAAYRDTLGWITLQLGGKQAACTELRRAIRGLPNSPDAHYHLAMAEDACGNKVEAKWHFQAAVAAGKRAREQKQIIPAGTAKAIELAKAHLTPQDNK